MTDNSDETATPTPEQPNPPEISGQPITRQRRKYKPRGERPPESKLRPETQLIKALNPTKYRARESREKEARELAVATARAAGVPHAQIAQELGIQENTSRHIAGRPRVRSLILELTAKHSVTMSESFGLLQGHIRETLDPETKDVTRRDRMEAGDRLIRTFDSAERAQARLDEAERNQPQQGGVMLQDVLLLMRQVRAVPEPESE